MTAVKRLQNRRRAWMQRLAEAPSRVARALVAWDRVRAAARAAERAGRPEAWDDITESLAAIAAKWENWEA